MNRPFATVACALAWACLVVACDKKEAGGGGAPAPSAKASVAVVASASASASAKPAAPLEVSGSYEAKLGEVRTPKDAPAFSNVVTGALGKGELSMVLPAEGDGAVTGKASGPLGGEGFSGLVEDGRLTGTLSPAAGDREAMTGVVMGTVSGKGGDRLVEGSIRASGADGRVVREAAFKLEPAKR